jgi:hypothetical protein
MISCRDHSCPKRAECACYRATGYPSGGSMVRWDGTGAGGCPHFEPCPVCLGKGEVLTPEGTMHWCGMCAGTGDLDD